MLYSEENVYNTLYITHLIDLLNHTIKIISISHAFGPFSFHSRNLGFRYSMLVWGIAYIYINSKCIILIFIKLSMKKDKINISLMTTEKVSRNIVKGENGKKNKGKFM